MTKIDGAKGFLLEALKNGPVNAADIFRRGKAAGHSERTLKRAKGELCIVSTRTGGSGAHGSGEWVWSLSVLTVPSGAHIDTTPAAMPLPEPLLESTRQQIEGLLRMAYGCGVKIMLIDGALQYVDAELPELPDQLRADFLKSAADRRREIDERHSEVVRYLHTTLSSAACHWFATMIDGSLKRIITSWRPTPEGLIQDIAELVPGVQSVQIF